MASIDKRGTKWRCRVQREGKPTLSKTFELKRDALRWGREIETEMDKTTQTTNESGEGQATDNPPKATDTTATNEETSDTLGTLGDLIKRYRLEVTPTKRGAVHEACWLKHFERDPLAQIRLSELTASHVAEYRDRRLGEVTASTLLRVLQSVSACLNHARKEWAMPIKNVVSDVRKPPPNPGRTRILTQEEETRLLDVLQKGGRDENGQYLPGTRNPWVYAAVVLALTTAMRRGELLALRWEHVDLNRRVAFLPQTKNGDSRTVPLMPRALELLASLPHSECGRVIPLTGNALQKAFTRARVTAGLPDVHLHDARHCAITKMSELLPNVIELAAVSGHKDLQMLKRYYHPNPETLALKLAGLAGGAA